MKALETISSNINKSMQKDMRTLGFARFQCDLIPMIVPHLHIAFRNGYAMNVYEEDGKETVEVNVTKDGKCIEKHDGDYAIEFLNAVFESNIYGDYGEYATGCYCGISIKRFVMMFKYFKSIK